MKLIDELIKNKNDELNQLVVPDELENRLERALGGKVSVRPRKYLAVVIAVLLIFMIGFNFDALAYMTKRFVGYDSILSDTLSDLNEQGKGQIIGEKINFDGGPTVSIDALMMDDSQTILFYTVEGYSDDVDVDVDMAGWMLPYDPESGMGAIDYDLNTLTFIQHYEPLRFYERSVQLNVKFYRDGRAEKKSIKVKIDRDKAMGKTMKVQLNKEMELEGQRIMFEELLVTPTQTVLTGYLESPFEMLLKEVKGGGMDMRRLSLVLLGDGVEIESLGSGYSTGPTGVTFHSEYNPLGDIDVLEVLVETLSVVQDVKESFEGDRFDCLDNEIVIESTWIENDKTYVTFTTESHVRLVDPELVSDERYELIETINSHSEKREDGIYHTRTMVFKGAVESFSLYINRIRYDKASGESMILWSK